MNTLLVKKVPHPWKYDVSLNGVDIPFVEDVKIVREEKSMPRCVITVVIPEDGVNGSIVIVEE